MAWDRCESNMFKQNLGSNIKRRRIEMNLNIEGLAILTNSSKSYIWNVDNGLIDPSISKMIKIAKALETDVQTLIS